MQTELDYKLPLITVLMTVRNEEKFLTQALVSILESSLKAFELIVINDASTDTTSKILEKFSLIDKRIRVFENSHQIGLAASLNKAFKYSKGKFIARMDGDDICHVDRLMFQYKFLIKNPNVDILGCNAKLIDHEGNTLGHTNMKKHHLDIVKQLNFRCPMIHPSILMKREVFENIGGYNTNLKRAQDFEFWINAKKLGYVFANLNREFLQYRTQVRPSIKITLLTFLSHMKICKKQQNFVLFIYSFFELLLFLLKLLKFVRNKIVFFTKTRSL